MQDITILTVNGHGLKEAIAFVSIDREILTPILFTGNQNLVYAVSVQINTVLWTTSTDGTLTFLTVTDIPEMFQFFRSNVAGLRYSRDNGAVYCQTP